MAQFGRALSELNIEILCANSSQVKGRVERANRTLQDRLVKSLRLAGVDTIAAGNAFLPGFMARHNARFAKVPARPDDLHRALNVEPDRLAGILCYRDKRYVGRDLTLKHDRRRIRLEVNARASVACIAGRLSRHRSTIYRGIRRNRFDEDQLPAGGTSTPTSV